ncbi:hypothetical protein IMZ48_13320 [Candidatus Bathyarchaeota archaeon]|nr:hypothetical protein [Candidatus Bathyarchaeota archaeon]
MEKLAVGKRLQHGQSAETLMGRRNRERDASSGSQHSPPGDIVAEKLGRRKGLVTGSGSRRVVGVDGGGRITMGQKEEKKRRTIKPRPYRVGTSLVGMEKSTGGR